MESPVHRRFLSLLAILTVCAILLVELIAPSTPVIRLLYAIGLLSVAFVLAYVFT